MPISGVVLLLHMRHKTLCDICTDNFLNSQFLKKINMNGANIFETRTKAMGSPPNNNTSHSVNIGNVQETYSAKVKTDFGRR
jgi:hypothetical protein